jgi:hypothetical protein
MEVDYSIYDYYKYPVLIFNKEGLLQYMNNAAVEALGRFRCGVDRCHFVYRNLDSECNNHIKCVCGKTAASSEQKVSFIRALHIEGKDRFFITERQPISHSVNFIEHLYDFTPTAEHYIEKGWMTKEELENIILETESQHINDGAPLAH